MGCHLLETGSLASAQAGLKLTRDQADTELVSILLPLPPKFKDWKPEPPHGENSSIYLSYLFPTLIFG